MRPLRSLRPLRFALAAISLIASTAFATPADPKNGAEYTTLAAPQPAQVVGKKVEVIEFFMFHCPACHYLEPQLSDWVKKQGDNVNFKRIHLGGGQLDPEAHLFLTLEAMGKAEEFVPKVFRAFHVDRQRLVTDKAILEWVGKSGLDKAKFMEAWNSFGVLTKLRRSPQILANYRIESSPTIVVDGRFVTSPASVGEANPSLKQDALAATIKVLDVLVAKVKQEKFSK